MKATAAGLAGVLWLAGCSGGAGDGASPAPLTKASLTAAADELPVLSGAYGELPTIAYPLKPGASSPSPTPTEEATDAGADASATDGTDGTDGTDAGTGTDTTDGTSATDATDGGTGTADAATETEATDATGTETTETADTTGTETTDTTGTETTETADTTGTETTDTTAEDETSPSPSPSETPSPYLDPPTSLQVQVQEGMTGDPTDAIKDENLAAINFAVWHWGETEPSYAANTFDYGDPLVFPVRSDNPVLLGISRAVIGQNVGSRILAVIPPAVGSLASAIGADEGTTLVAVIDILEQFDKDIQAQADAVPTGAVVGPVIQGPLGGPATITVPSGLDEPTEISATVIATGTGPVLEDGQQVLIHYAAVNWAGQADGNTWTTGMGPEAVILTADPYGDGSQLLAYSLLVGLPVGSRVLILTPGKEGSYQADAIVVDLVALVGTTDADAEGTASPSATPTDSASPAPSEATTSSPSPSPSG
jgi:peptidylprolyl isomerase